MKKLALIIPAYNEEKRIERTIRAYHAFFTQQVPLEVELVVVLNGCHDRTGQIVGQLRQELGGGLQLIDLPQAGKGLAIKAGFEYALAQQADLIGFVDADMATKPKYFFDLIIHLDRYDGIIASRYMPGAQIFPARPWIKRWGSRLVYEPLVYLLFGLSYYDLQCGAKLFTASSLAQIVPLLAVRQWAFDVELLYLYKKKGFTLKEHPTVWTDQAGSKLRLNSGFLMLGSLFAIRLRNSFFGHFFSS